MLYITGGILICNMRVFIHELKANYKSLLGWIAGVLFLQVSGYTKFEGFKAAQSGAINSLTRSFPKAMLVIFGMNDLNIGTLIGYFGILYLFFALIAIIYSGLLGAGIISKEERDKTSEFLYTRPISRSKILTAKLCAGLVNIFILFAVLAVSSVVGVGIVNGNYTLSSQVMNMMWGIMLMQIFFFSLGILFAGICKNPKLPSSLVTIVIVVAYFGSVVADLSSYLDWLKYFSPLKWFSAPAIINAGHTSYSYAVLTVVLSVIFIILSYIFYNKRDLTVA
jgi:ABC-2 type transport system permease protein